MVKSCTTKCHFVIFKLYLRLWVWTFPSVILFVIEGVDWMLKKHHNIHGFNYRTNAQCYAERGYATVCRLSVRLSVCDVQVPWYGDHIAWNTSKIIPRPNSLRYLTLTSTSAILSCGNTPKLGWNRGGVMSTKTCNICETVQDRIEVLWRTNRKSHTRFRLIPKSTTLDDIEWPKRTIAEK